jgi:valyl-tRNA synthetase
MARNFCNKLWNASRFVMINLEGYQPQSLDISSLPLEDRWILSRLSTTIQQAGAALEAYHHSEAARLLHDFAWDEFCSYYVEMAKPRLQNPAQRPITQQVLAHTLDQLLRLLHPLVPFITEAIWQQLGNFGLQRTLDGQLEQNKWLMKSAWPEPERSHQDRQIEEQFASFVAVLGALREIRSRQNIPPKETIRFTVACDARIVALLEPMQPFFQALARAECTGLGGGFAEPDVPPAKVSVEGMEVTVDLGQFINVEAEIDRNVKLLENLVKQISSKQAKLSNENFVKRAPAKVVEKERAGLADLQQQQESVSLALERLRKTQ